MECVMTFLKAFVILSLALGFTSACGDDFKVNSYPRIEVRVDSVEVDQQGGTTYFPPAVQLPTDKQIEIVNPGTEDLIISSIDWQAADGGGVAKNPHVEYDLSSMNFPYTLGADGDKVAFKVTYSPPPNSADKDFNLSILVIKSNARNAFNTADISQVVLTLAMQEKKAYPTMNPPSYQFNNASPTKPETQVFRIESHQEFGLAPFTVNDVLLQSPSDVFILSSLPNQGTVVQAGNDPMYEPAEFTVTYKPNPVGQGETQAKDSNTIIVETDAGTLTVPLTTNYIPGSYSLSYSHVDELDFTNVFTQEARRIVLLSEGPGPLTVKEPRIEPSEANSVFTWKAYKPLTSPEAQPEEITSFPRGLAGGASIEFEIIYAPGNNPGESPSGDFIVPVSMPAEKEIKMKIFAGDPKPILDIAPVNNLVYVSADLAAGETGSKPVVLYNNGNGGLVLKDVAVTGNFGLEAKVFSLPGGPAPDTVIQPGAMLVVNVAWDASKVPVGKDDATEALKISYIHFSDGEVSETLQLQITDAAGATVPTADAGGNQTGLKVGEPAVLSALESSSGDYDFTGSWAFFYLLEKPVGSWAEFNTETNGFADFIPDVAGDYEVGLVVYSYGADDYFFSEPTSVTLTVAAP
jgi:hypothetical protein